MRIVKASTEIMKWRVALRVWQIHIDARLMQQHREDRLARAQTTSSMQNAFVRTIGQNNKRVDVYLLLLDEIQEALHHSLVRPFQRKRYRSLAFEIDFEQLLLRLLYVSSDVSSKLFCFVRGYELMQLCRFDQTAACA